MSIKTYVVEGDLVTFQKYKGEIYWAKVVAVDEKHIHMVDLNTPVITQKPVTLKTTVFSKVERIPPYVVQAIRDKMVQEG